MSSEYVQAHIQRCFICFVWFGFEMSYFVDIIRCWWKTGEIKNSGEQHGRERVGWWWWWWFSCSSKVTSLTLSTTRNIQVVMQPNHTNAHALASKFYASRICLLNHSQSMQSCIHIYCIHTHVTDSFSMAFRTWPWRNINLKHTQPRPIYTYIFEFNARNCASLTNYYIVDKREPPDTVYVCVHCWCVKNLPTQFSDKMVY